MYLAAFTEPEKLDHEPLVPFFHFPALTSHDPLTFFKVDFHPRERTRELESMPFMSYIHTLNDDMCKIGMESPDAEL
jgi:hypothetical protein